MAQERPLYTLYKNLKAQNYDVPDDYDKFESALTRDGKAGADNRHAIYQNLKAQNFDVPDNYERFYSALFEPRNKDSSRAKGGSVPMSEADKTRFIVGANNIAYQGQQTVKNAGRYNNLKQRKQKQQRDFGRVNIGAHQTPYGGDVNNVLQDDSTGQYVTSDSETTNNLAEAQEKQAVLDEYGKAYQNAVDTGEVPSVFDVRDKKGNYDLQENIGKGGTYLTEEGAQNQLERKLQDAYARKKEIEDAIAEDDRKNGNPLLSYSASLGGGNGRDAESSDYRNKLATSLSLITQQIGALEAVKQYPTSSWGEDAWKALDNTAFTAKTWDFGLSDFATMGQMERIKTKMDNNVPLSGSDKMLLNSKLGADAAAALEDEKMGSIYRWTKIAGQSLPFMADFFLTGGYGGITKAMGRGALKFAAKRGMGKVSAAILKNTGIVAGDVIGSYAMAGTEQALKTGADIMQRHMGNLYQDENGNYAFGTFDENGNLLHEGGETIGKALYKGLTSAMVENYTEKLFGHNYGIKKGALNFMEKHGMGRAADFFKNIGQSGWYRGSKKWMEKFGINGFGEEVMEEEIGIPLHALLDGDNKMSDLLDPKQQLDIIGGMAISVGSMYAMGMGTRPIKGAYNRAQYYRFKHKVDVADSNAQQLLGDNWESWKEQMDNATNDKMGGVLYNILHQRDNMSKEQINAAIQYGVNLMKMRGYNLIKTAEMKAKELTGEQNTEEDKYDNDIDNAYSEGHEAEGADTHSIQLEQNASAMALANMLGISEEKLHDMSDDELEAMTGQNDKLDQAIYDYQTSTARYQGVMDNANDKVDMAAQQAAMLVDQTTDLSRGTVRNATIKATKGAEDYGVYIISGNLATHDDGTINVSDSDQMILYYDPTTGRKEHADPSRFAALGDENPAEEVKAQAIADAKEKAIREVAGIIDGKVEVGSQFNVTDSDGTQHTYEVLADNGDGTAMVTLDGNVEQNPYSFEDLQNLKDAEDEKTMVAARQQRAELEAQREQQKAEQQKQEEEKQAQQNQAIADIIDDNGNVVFAAVKGDEDADSFIVGEYNNKKTGVKKYKVVTLNADGTVSKPILVDSSKVSVINTMSADEYKQTLNNAETSPVVDNGGENVDNNEVPLQSSEETTAVDGNAENTAEPERKDETEKKEASVITLEDGTVVPMLEDGNPDFSQLSAAQTAELYDEQFGEDADGVIRGWVNAAKKELDKANNMTIKGKNFVEQKASKAAKEKAIADAQAAYDSAKTISDAYNERQLAKEEGTPEGRKNLIEKAKAKFARLKNKDEWKNQTQALWNDTIGNVLHRLYDGLGVNVFDHEPQTVEEYVSSSIAPHSLNYEGTETSKGVKQETGLQRKDFTKSHVLAAEGKGVTVDDFVHKLWDNRPSQLENVSGQEIRNTLLDLITSDMNAYDMQHVIENNRIAQAEKEIEDEKTAAENAQMSNQSNKSAPNKSENGADNANDGAESTVDSESEVAPSENENFPGKLKEPSQEETTEVPEDSTPEKPLGEQKDSSPFSAKDEGERETPEERAANVEKNKVDGTDVVDAIIGKKMRKSLARIAKMMGAKIQYQYTDKMGNGWYDANTNTIYLTLDSSLTEGVQFIFGHEMTHEIKTKNPSAYNELAQLVKDSITDFDKAVDEMEKRYSDAGLSGYDRTYYEEEVVADGIGHMLQDLNYAHTLALKMSHPLLAKIHEIINRIRMAFHGTEYTEQAKDIMRSIERAYVATANREAENAAIQEGEGGQRLSLRTKEAPKKTQKVFKLMRLNPAEQGKLFPLFIGNGEAVELGKWYDADSPKLQDLTSLSSKEYVGTRTVSKDGKKVKESYNYGAYIVSNKTGEAMSLADFKTKNKGNKDYSRMGNNPNVAALNWATDNGYRWIKIEEKNQGQSRYGGENRSYYNYGINGTGSVSIFAMRPGWHAGSLPTMRQIGKGKDKDLRDDNFVWVEGEIPADIDYNEEAQMNADKDIPDHIPTDGYYLKATNANKEASQADKVGWYVAGAFKANRIMSDKETRDIIDQWNNEHPSEKVEYDWKRESGKDFNAETMSLEGTPKFSIRVYHGSGADFSEFDFSHMSEGAGSQTFGWGGYVTSSKKIGKDYAMLKDNSYSNLKTEAKKFLETYPTYESFLANHKRIGARQGLTEDEKKEFYKRMVNAANVSRNLYEVNIPDDNGSNYLDWDGEIPSSINKEDIAKDMLDNIKKEEGEKEDWELESLENDINDSLEWANNGEELYKAISLYLGDKAASKFLSSLGYTGIKYKAGRNFGGAEEGDTNYVIFKPEDMQIAEHTKFSLKGNDSKDFDTRLKSAIDETETNPSEAQKESGNYKKGHVKFGGYDYTIENPKGSVRSGVDENGKPWSIKMHDTYGYIRGKFGKDGDHLDMFINDNADLDNWDGDVYVVDQVNPGGSFDEHKVMYGYDSMDDAKKAYLANYSKGWQGLGNITGASKDEFDKWLDTSKRKLKPFADYAKVKFSQAQSMEVDNNPMLSAIHTLYTKGKEFASKLFNMKYFDVVKTPDFMKSIGLTGDKFTVRYGVMSRHFGKDGSHNFTEEEWRQLPNAIKNPFAISKLTDKKDGYRLYTTLKTGKGEYVVVGADVKNAGRNLEVNSIVTIFGRRNDANLPMNEEVIYKNPKITPEQMALLSQPNSDQYPSTQELSAAKIDNSSETSKKNGEKFSLKDEEYMKAVEDGDMEKAQKMVNEAAEAAGYSTDSSYQGTSAFNGAAPWGNAYFLTKEERKEAWDNGEFEGESSLGDYINDDIDGGNLEELTNAASYRAADPMRKEAIDNVRNAIQKKSKTITMYRSVPSDVKEGSFRNGDWVTPSRAYAVDNAKVHGWGENYNIIEQKVPVDDVWFDGNDIAEWGYGREEDYVNDTDFAYKNTKNNRKLLDAVTYDDNGNVIPLSQRFNENNEDVRYSLKDEKTMFGMHNISLDKLRKAIKQGGFAAPSMGVIDSKNGIYSDYGEITLIPKAEKLAKSKGKNAGTFLGDGWTPIYPKVEKIMTKQGEKAFNADMDKLYDNVDVNIWSNIKDSWKAYFSNGDVRDGLYFQYLQEKGMKPEVVYQKGKYDKSVLKKVESIIGEDGFNKTDFSDEEISGLLKLMNEVTGKDNSFEGQRKSLEAEKEDAEKKGNKLLVGLLNRRLEKLDKEDDFWIAVGFMREVAKDYSRNGKVKTFDTINAAKQKVVGNEKLSADFNTWLDKKSQQYDSKEMLYTGTTPSGKPKYIPNTVENAVKLMKKKELAGGYGMFGGIGSFIAKHSDMATTLKQMKAANGKLISKADAEKRDKMREEINREFRDLANQIDVPGGYSFDSGDARMLELADHKGHEKEYIKKEYGMDVSDDWVERYNDLVNTIKNDYPVYYFETKFMRPYGLDEFEKAIVPKDTPKDVLDALKKAGIDVHTYEGKEDREKVTMDAVNNSDNIRFSLTGEQGATAADDEDRVTTRMDNLQIAQGMEKEKKDAKAIKLATGWERGTDGRWRYEIPDFHFNYDKWRDKNKEVRDSMSDKDYRSLMRYTNDFYEDMSPVRKRNFDELRRRTGYKIEEELTLGDVLDGKGAKNLFKYYPELRDVKFEYANLGAYTIGSFDKDTNTIKVNQSLMYNPSKTEWNLLHEVQHAIQTIEGFAHGGSDYTVRGDMKKRLDEVTEQIRNLKAEGKDDEAKALIKKNKGLYNAYTNETDDFKNYQALAGEVEARNVQKRLGMTDEERRNSLASETEDVAREDQIFLGVDGNDTKFSLRVDQYQHDLEQWKKDNNLPKDAVRPSIPVREPNESATDFVKRVKEYRKQMALWKTAPQYEQHLLTSNTAQGQFNLELQKGSVLARIALQDSMLPIRKAQEAIMKEVGIDRLNIAEDAYTAENRSHGKGKNEFEEYNDEFLQPLRKSYNKMMKNLGKSYDNVKVYMMAKHGLERNAHIAFKESLDADYEKQEERINAYKAYKVDMDRMANNIDFENGKIGFTTWRQNDNAIRTKYAPSYLDYRYDKMGITQDYSGLSALFDGSDFEEAAAELVKDVETKFVGDTNELWYNTNAATKKILRDSWKAGMMSDEVYEFVRGMYDHYIPLRGWGDTNADQVWNYMGGGKGAFSQTLKEAKGRGSLADDPIAYIENMAESGILINNKNWVKQHLLLLAENHPTSLLNISKAWYIKTADANGNEEWIPASPQITANMTASQVEAALDAFQKKMETMEKKGDATQKREHLEISYPQTNGEEREHEVRVMKNGEEYVIYVNGDPQLAQAMNNTRATRVRQGLENSISKKAIALLGRKMAAAYTSMSPLFIPSNYFRDFTMTLASTAIREDARYNYLLRKNMTTHWSTFPLVLSYQNGTLREKVRDGEASKTEQMFYDFMMNGGETGFVSSLDVEDLKKKFKNDLKDMNRMAVNPKKIGHVIMDSIETLNRAIEDSNRFMVYMTSIQYGRSIDEAVNDAKDVTLNFNRKGTGEHGWQTFRNLYLFINPAIQSLQTLGALAKHHKFKFTAVTTAWLASGLLVPIINSGLMDMFGGDDDKDKYWSFTKWDRRNNLVMWIPLTHNFVKIPLAQEFRGFYGVGDMIASKLWGGEKAEESWEDYGLDLMGQVVDMLPLDPTGYDGNIAVSLMPNPIRPMFELAFNVDFTGKPIFKDSEYNKYDPNFTKAFAGTPDWLVRISKMVNSVGNDYPDVQQNAIDKFGDPRFNLNNPAVVDHVLSSYLGGAYTMGSQILGVATKALNGDEIKMADVPLASKFVSNPNDRPVSKKQGDEFWTTKERHDRAANTLSKLKKKAKVDGDYSTLDVFFNSDEYEQYKKDDKVVKNYEEDKKKERAEESGDEYKPHKTTYDDIYKAHATPKDDFEDLKMSQIYPKVNGIKKSWESLLDMASSQADSFYNQNADAIQAADNVANLREQINDIKKNFLSEGGKDTYNAEGMKQIRQLRKEALDILEKANKVIVAKQKAKADKQ